MDHPLIADSFYAASSDNPSKDKGTNYSNILPKDGRKLIFDMSPVLIRGGKAIKEYSYAEHTSVMEPWQSAQMILSGEPESDNSVDCGQSNQYVLPLLFPSVCFASYWSQRQTHAHRIARAKAGFPSGVLADWASVSFFGVFCLWRSIHLLQQSPRLMVRFHHPLEGDNGAEKMTAARMFKERRNH